MKRPDSARFTAARNQTPSCSDMAVTGCWHSDRITLSTLILGSDLLVCDSVTRHRVRGSLTITGRAQAPDFWSWSKRALAA